MACYRPLHGYKALTTNPSGKRSIVFNSREGYGDLKIVLPCGQCIGCRLERSRQWAIRCVHEASLYEENSYITLTYEEKKLPPHGSLLVSDFQKFMKRLRKKYSSKIIRFFQCGEYGEQGGRPHYHACLFNHDFNDKVPWKQINGHQLYTSQALSDLWPLGFSTVGALTFESAAYVARYITKKITGPRAKLFYEGFDEETGEYFQIKPEYTTMSRGGRGELGGIGKGWYEKYKGDVYPHGFVILRGKKLRPPKFYDSQFEITDPAGYAQVKADRQNKGALHAIDNTHERLAVREDCKILQVKRLKRSYENNET